MYHTVGSTWKSKRICFYTPRIYYLGAEEHLCSLSGGLHSTLFVKCLKKKSSSRFVADYLFLGFFSGVVALGFLLGGLALGLVWRSRSWRPPWLLPRPLHRGSRSWHLVLLGCLVRGILLGLPFVASCFVVSVSSKFVLCFTHKP